MAEADLDDAVEGGADNPPAALYRSSTITVVTSATR